MITSSMQKVLIVGFYQLNKTYITKVYCENKDKPEMHCDGQCHLEKTLEKNTKQKDSDENGILNRVAEEITALNNDFSIQPIVYQRKVYKNIFKEYKFYYHFSFENHLLKPPQHFIA
ncbi:MAG: hypothetical protein H6553_10725 [Chitinophagales bacterium]|nr:hypothetical protein [Chitinophagales bacterium]